MRLSCGEGPSWRSHRRTADVAACCRYLVSTGAGRALTHATLFVQECHLNKGHAYSALSLVGLTNDGLYVLTREGP